MSAVSKYLPTGYLVIYQEVKCNFIMQKPGKHCSSNNQWEKLWYYLYEILT